MEHPQMNQTNEKTSGRKGGKSSSERWVKRGFLLVLLLAVVIIGYMQFRGPRLGWSGDLEQALSAAKAEGRCVVVFVRSFPTSATGKWMVSKTLSKGRNKEALEKGNFLLVEIRLDRSSDWAKKYGVTKTPTMLLIAPDGEKFHKAEGKIGETDFRHKFLKALTPEDAPSNSSSTP